MSLDVLLEHAVRAGVGDHQGGEPVLVLLGLGPQVGQLDVALLVAGDGDDLQAGDDRAAGVGAVGGDGDEADVAVALAAGLVVGADGEQAGVFALRAGVGLERHGGEAGDLGEPGFQVLEELLVACGLVGRGERVDAGRTPAR